MVDQARIINRINYGYAKAASKLGSTYNVFRPIGPDSPLEPDKTIGSLLAVFDNKSTFEFSDTSPYAKPTAWGLFDGTTTQPGDYLTNWETTYFIAAERPIQPMMCVECNRVLSFTQQAAPDVVGTNPYGGRTEATEVGLMKGWPASVLLGTKGETTTAHLPSDTRAGWWSILMPYWDGVYLRMGDSFEDDIGRRFIVSAAELSSLGWRITAAQAET